MHSSAQQTAASVVGPDSESEGPAALEGIGGDSTLALRRSICDEMALLLLALASVSYDFIRVMSRESLYEESQFFAHCPVAFH